MEGHDHHHSIELAREINIIYFREAWERYPWEKESPGRCPCSSDDEDEQRP